ncbi:MAG: HEAT repeat domain-containing protein [Pirellulales bacterium]
MRRTYRSRWVYRLGILGVLASGAAAWTFGCSRSESSLPESIQKKIRDSNQTATQQEDEKLRPTVASDGVTTRFTVRPFEDWTMREAAAVALGRIGEPAVPALVEALRSHDPEIRLQAADTLARIGPGAEQAVPSLTELLEDEDIRIRKAAARALGQIGPKAAESVPSLMRALESP